MRTAIAVIRWLTAEEGGRRTGNPNSEYCACLNPKEVPSHQFHTHENPSENFINSKIENGWDLKIKKLAELNNLWMASVRFISEEPAKFLLSDATFELFEGARLVATGKVLY